MIGVLLALADPLARDDVSIFAISTHDTDYVLVPRQTYPARASHSPRPDTRSSIPERGLSDSAGFRANHCALRPRASQSRSLGVSRSRSHSGKSSDSARVSLRLAPFPVAGPVRRRIGAFGFSALPMAEGSPVVGRSRGQCRSGFRGAEARAYAGRSAGCARWCGWRPRAAPRSRER